MILGIAEDFTSDVTLDSDLLSVSDSSLFLNSGVHPSITIENLLYFLPNLDITLSVYGAGTTYTKYETSRKRSDLVTYSGSIYQSLVDSNTGNQPDVSSTEWLLTDYNSLRIKNFIYQVKDKVYADLRLVRRLINNQYIYEVGDTSVSLPNDYAAWVIEPKGSDYVRFTLNQVSLQKAGTTPVNMYVVNQGDLVTTLSITPGDSDVSFQDVNYSFSGFGKWIFAIDSTDVITRSGGVDPLKYDGFLAYTANGTGASAQAATYSYGSTSNGLGINLSAFLDSSVYIDNNAVNFAPYIRAAFEYMTFQMFLHNSHNRSNRAERLQMSEDMLIAELKEKNVDSVYSRYIHEKNKAVKVLGKTFDTQLADDDNGLDVTITSI